MIGLYRVHFMSDIDPEAYQGDVRAVNAKGFDDAARKVLETLQDVHVYMIEFVEERKLSVV